MNAIPRLFVDRPIFAVVLSALMLVAGGLALLRLPLSEYPAVTPPTVQVVAQFPGAAPRELAETVAAPIEQEVNGVEGMLYMTSQSVDGQVTLAVTFTQGTDPHLAQIRVQRALPRLPEEVQRQGVVPRAMAGAVQSWAGYPCRSWFAIASSATMAAACSVSAMVSAAPGARPITAPLAMPDHLLDHAPGYRADTDWIGVTINGPDLPARPLLAQPPAFPERAPGPARAASR